MPTPNIITIQPVGFARALGPKALVGNIRAYPSHIAKPTQTQECIGDLHGNLVLLLNTLVQRGLVQCTEAAYLEFVKLADEARDRGIRSHQTQEALQDFLNRFDAALLKLHGVNPDNKISLRFLGDIFRDRGQNDGLMLRMLAHLAKSFPCEINASNHDDRLVREMLSGKIEENKVFVAELRRGQERSYENMLAWFKLSPSFKQETLKLIDEVYLPRLRLVNYTHHKSAPGAPRQEYLVFSTHAPSNVENIVQLLHLFAHMPWYSACDGDEQVKQIWLSGAMKRKLAPVHAFLRAHVMQDPEAYVAKLAFKPDAVNIEQLKRAIDAMNAIFTDRAFRPAIYAMLRNADEVRHGKENLSNGQYKALSHILWNRAPVTHETTLGPKKIPVWVISGHEHKTNALVSLDTERGKSPKVGRYDSIEGRLFALDARNIVDASLKTIKTAPNVRPPKPVVPSVRPKPVQAAKSKPVVVPSVRPKPMQAAKPKSKLEVQSAASSFRQAKPKLKHLNTVLLQHYQALMRLQNRFRRNYSANKHLLDQAQFKEADQSLQQFISRLNTVSQQLSSVIEQPQRTNITPQSLREALSRAKRAAEGCCLSGPQGLQLKPEFSKVIDRGLQEILLSAIRFLFHLFTLFLVATPRWLQPTSQQTLLYAAKQASRWQQVVPNNAASHTVRDKRQPD